MTNLPNTPVLKPKSKIARVLGSRWLPWVAVGVLLIALISVAGAKPAAVETAAERGAQQEVEILERELEAQAENHAAELEVYKAEVAGFDERIAACQSDIEVISSAGAEVANAFSESTTIMIDVLTYGADQASVDATMAINERVQAATDSLDAVQGCS
jgi:hypothetical protein